MVAAALVLAACGGSAHRRVSAPRATTTTTAAAVTTTAAPVTEPPTSAAPPPAPPTPATLGPLPAAITTPNGVTLRVTGRAAGGADAYTVTMPCGDTATAHGTPTTPPAIVLDPGHGGREMGAISPTGLAEKTVNLAVAQQAKAALEQAGVATVLTRAGDYGMTLTERAQLTLALKPKAFVSLHHNSEPDGPFDRPGSETYYQIGNGQSKRLAGLIYEEVVKALHQYDNQVSWVADTDAGAKYRPGQSGGDYYAVLRQTHGVPAALAELAYISDPAEAQLLARPDVQKTEGQAVARGIIRYLSTDDPGSGFTTPYPRTEPAGGGGGPQGCVNPPIS